MAVWLVHTCVTGQGGIGGFVTGRFASFVNVLLDPQRNVNAEFQLRTVVATAPYLSSLRNIR